MKKQESQAVFFQQALWLSFVMQMFLLREIEIINHFVGSQRHCWPKAESKSWKQNTIKNSFMKKKFSFIMFSLLSYFQARCGVLSVNCARDVIASQNHLSTYTITVLDPSKDGFVISPPPRPQIVEFSIQQLPGSSSWLSLNIVFIWKHLILFQWSKAT